MLGSRQRIADRPEAAAVEETGAVEGELACVEGGAIAFVFGESMVGCEDVIKTHQVVADHLRDDGGATNHQAALIAMDDGTTRDTNRRNARAIDKHEIGNGR